MTDSEYETSWTQNRTSPRSDSSDEDHCQLGCSKLPRAVPGPARFFVEISKYSYIKNQAPVGTTKLIGRILLVHRLVYSISLPTFRLNNRVMDFVSSTTRRTITPNFHDSSMSEGVWPTITQTTHLEACKPASLQACKHHAPFTPSFALRHTTTNISHSPPLFNKQYYNLQID